MGGHRERIWTCRISGATDMTHSEATISEGTRALRLRTEFLPVFEEPVLELVHHCSLLAVPLSCFSALCAHSDTNTSYSTTQQEYFSEG